MATLQSPAEFEQHYEHIHRMQLHAKWIQLLRAQRLQQLHAELARLPTTAQQHVDMQAQHLAQLQQDLQVATDEYNTAASSHKQLIQQLLDLHKQHVAHIEQRACAQITQLLDAFSIDHTTREKRLGTYIPIMQHILHAARAHYTQQQRHATLTAENAMQGLQNAAADALTTVDLGYQERMRVLQGAYDDLQRGFDVKYGQQVQQAAILERQDAEMRQQVGVLGRVLSGLNATAARWRAKLSHLSMDWEARNGALVAEKQRLTEIHTQLRNRLVRFQQSSQQRLCMMCTQCEDVEQQLKQHVDLLQSIVNTVNACETFNASDPVNADDNMGKCKITSAEHTTTHAMNENIQTAVNAQQQQHPPQQQQQQQQQHPAHHNQAVHHTSPMQCIAQSAACKWNMLSHVYCALNAEQLALDAAQQRVHELQHTRRVLQAALQSLHAASTLQPHTTSLVTQLPHKST